MSKGLRRSLGEGHAVEDPSTIDNIVYNDYAGADKHINVGPALEFISVTTTEVGVIAGDQLYFYKTTVGPGFVKMAEATGVAIPGAVPAADTFPIKGQVLTALSAANYRFVRGAADIYLYKLKDDNHVRVNP